MQTQQLAADQGTRPPPPSGCKSDRNRAWRRAQAESPTSHPRRELSHEGQRLTRGNDPPSLFPKRDLLRLFRFRRPYLPSPRTSTPRQRPPSRRSTTTAPLDSVAVPEPPLASTESIESSSDPGRSVRSTPGGGEPPC